MDYATTQAILSRIAPQQSQNPVASLMANRGAAPTPGGGSPGIGGIGDAIMRRLSAITQQAPPPTAPPGMVPAPGNGGDRTFMGPNDHIGLSEVAQGSLLDQVANEIARGQIGSPPPPVGGSDTTARAAPGDHIGLSELAQGSLLDQLVEAIRNKTMPGSNRGTGAVLLPTLPGQMGGPPALLPNTGFAPTWSRRVTT